MNNIEKFCSNVFGEIRTLLINDEVWFVGKDVAEALGYSNPNDALKKRVDNEDKGVANCDTLGGKQDMTIINESGLYSLILSSKLPQAKQFKRWITTEVIPSIRKHGGYIHKQEELTDREILAKAYMLSQSIIKEKEEENQKLLTLNSELTVENQIMKPKADYFDELVDRNLLTNFTETAKILGIKPKKFIQFLIDKKFIYRDKKDKLVPYSNKNNGLFEIKESVNHKTNWVGVQTLVTPKGRETFRLLFID